MGSLGRQLKRRQRQMVANARRAVAIAGLDAEVRCVAGRGQGAAHRIFQTPGMLIDGRRIVMGRTLPMDAMLKTLKALGYTDEK